MPTDFATDPTLPAETTPLFSGEALLDAESWTATGSQSSSRGSPPVSFRAGTRRCSATNSTPPACLAGRLHSIEGDSQDHRSPCCPQKVLPMSPTAQPALGKCIGLRRSSASARVDAIRELVRIDPSPTSDRRDAVPPFVTPAQPPHLSRIAA
jgi:hypothetical protein